MLATRRVTRARVLHMGESMLNKRPSLPLPSGVTLADAAEGARDAVRQFLSLPQEDKRALSAWLLGPYQHATRFSPKGITTRRDSVPPPSAPPVELRLEEVVAAAKQALDRAIEAATSELGAEALVRLLPPVVHVVPAHDIYGARGYVPVDVPGLRLADRVLALLVSDFLTRPDDFVQNAPQLRQPAASGVRRSGFTHRVDPDRVPTLPKLPASRG